MDRIHPAARAAQAHCQPRIAFLDALGLKALVMPTRQPNAFGMKDHVDFIAVGADRRLRCGAIRIVAEGDMPRAFPGIRPIHACRPPRDAGSLAGEIARAVDLAESDTAFRDYGGNPPFTLSGWSPATRSGAMRVSPELVSRRDLPGLEWLGGEPFSDEAANRLWDAWLAPLVTAYDLEAMDALGIAGFVDHVAFDACREPGRDGDARRAFARANPLVANAALRDPATRAMVDAGVRLGTILDALSGGGEIDLFPRRPGERRTVSKRALMAFSGRTLVPDTLYLHQDDALDAAEGLPRDWLPTTEAEATAFTRLCCVARQVYREPLQEAGEGMWRQAMAGAAGRWVEFERRVAEARGAFEGQDHAEALEPSMTVGLIQVETRIHRHFVHDVLAPVTMTYGDGTAIGLAGHVIHGRWRRQKADALRRFGREALLSGMALPAYADMLRRHDGARASIRSVMEAYPQRAVAPGSRPHPGIVILSNGMRLRPKAGWTSAPGPDAFAPGDEAGPTYPPSWSEVKVSSMDNAGILGLPDTMPDTDGRPTAQVAMVVNRMYAAYDVTAPGAVEAMLDAWRRALPRRWRKLDARALAAALDSEAAAFAATHGIETGAAAPVPSL